MNSTAGKILVVDDNDDNLYLLCNRLARDDYVTVAADSGEKALNLLCKEPFDLVLLDINMPDINGFQVLESIRNDKDQSELPVIMVTADENNNSIAKSLSLGANDYISKPVDFSVLIARVRTQLEIKHANEKLNIWSRDLEKITNDLAYKITHDQLTGLPNRTDFEKKLNFIFGSSDINRCQYILSYIDLDQFKIINEACGHAAGDELIRQVSEIIKSVVRDDDLLASMGADEFIILMKDSSIAQAQSCAERIQTAIAGYSFIWDEKKFSLTASIGIVEINKSIKSVSKLMSQADTACYMAKEGGRNRIHIHNQENTDIQQRHTEIQWINKINESLENNNFELWCQRIKDLKGNGHTQHYEILIRMLDDGIVIPPGNFLPAAERYGLSARIDQWVIEQTFRWIDTNSILAKDIHFSINLSGQTLSNHDLLEYIKEKMREFNVTPGNICFEITETAAIGCLKSALDFILDLKSFGCEFALDDFGSGMSSLSYLKNLPVDYLKIDGAFVKNIVTDNIDLTLVESVNDIGRAMGKKTIAEFVKDNKIMKILCKIGVDYAQGYGIQKPHPLKMIFP